MSWTVAQTTQLFRDLTGRKSSNQISDANILIKINHYYQHVFPQAADIKEFEGWYTFNTADGTGYQDIPDGTAIDGPAYVDDDDVSFWLDVERFYQEYPHDWTTENKPSDILLQDRRLILRPIPDDTYEVRLRKKTAIPDALTSGNLTNPTWGPVIGYGASIMYLLEQGEEDVAMGHNMGLSLSMANLRQQIRMQSTTGRRPRGGRF